MKLLFLTLILSVFAQANNFNNVKSELYTYKYKSLPFYESHTFKRILGLIWGNRNELTERAEQTFTDSSDYRDSSVKIFHPMGVCFTGEWKITEESPYRGLFSKNSKAQVIARLSTGQDDVFYKKGKSRIFGMAIKLFHNNLDESLNIQLLDQYGLGGSDRKSFFKGESDDIFFTNTIKSGLPLIGKLFDKAVSYIEPQPSKRPLHHIAEAFNESSVIPNNIYIYPKKYISLNEKDFRNELLAQDSISLDIFVDIENKKQSIGHITLTKAIANSFCDKRLHFAHTPNKNE